MTTMPRADRPYPPDWCDVETIAYLIDASPTVREYVERGLLPAPVKLGDGPCSAVRWSRQAVNEALARRAAGGNARRKAAPETDADDAIMRAARGEKAGARRGAA